jgi:hypothetical protein
MLRARVKAIATSEAAAKARPAPAGRSPRGAKSAVSAWVTFRRGM